MMRGSVAAILVLALFCPVQAQEAYTYPSQISVSGIGMAWAEPDMATITFGVDVTGYTAAEAVEQASEMMRGARDAARSHGVDPDDIATSSYSLWTEYEYDEYTYEYTDVLLYHVSDYASLKLYDIDDVGEVLAALVEGGANYISGVAFSVSDKSGMYDEARSHAVADAQNRAAQLAAATGVTLGEPTMISEYSYDYYDPYYGYDTSYMSASISMGEAGGGMAPPSISPATMSVQTTVSITYSIE
jgi:uncharacterized protein YggE